MRAIFQINKDENGFYTLPSVESLFYSTGIMVIVKREVDGVIVDVEVEEIRGGYTLLDAEADPLIAEIESSEAIIDDLKLDPNYVWLSDILEESN